MGATGEYSSYPEIFGKHRGGGYRKRRQGRIRGSQIVSAPVSKGERGRCFSGDKTPSSPWVGITGQLETFGRLQKTLDENLEAIGFSKEKRPFKGHLTLGRIKKKIDTKTFIEALDSFGNFETETFAVDRVVLYKSELKASGAVYTKLMSARLA